ncbi:MAG: hypothetical protein ACJ8AW_55030 [Rhodopila sp.]
MDVFIAGGMQVSRFRYHRFLRPDSDARQLAPVKRNTAKFCEFIDRLRNELAGFRGGIRLGVQREGDFGCLWPLGIKSGHKPGWLTAWLASLGLTRAQLAALLTTLGAESDPDAIAKRLRRWDAAEAPHNG